ncbi:MAG: NERD domain-containing protein, partial [Caldilineaceae bacterium]|nr:NERD domain-containing protein [Caldilineaceae bacterium]
MVKVIEVGQPVNEAERRAIAVLRDGLPEGYIILHNFEILRGDEFFEVDLAVVAPHGVYLIDVKGTRGQINVYGPKWHPQGRQPFTSPLLKLRGHARTLKGIITASQPGRRDLEGIYVDAVVLLTAPDAYLNDPDERDKPSVVTLDKAVPFFKNPARLPTKFSRNITALYRMIFGALQGATKPREEPLRFGSWQVTERLGSTDSYTEYRAVNPLGGKATGTVLLRVYRADPYLPASERAAQQRRITNAYRALSRLPAHPNIVRAQDFFADEEAHCYILVTEDVAGQALRLHLNQPTFALTLDQKLRIAQDLLGALAHAHRHEVIHRNLTPSTLLLANDGR